VSSDWVDEVTDEFAALDGVVSESYGDVVVDVLSARWVDACTKARDSLRLSFFDWLSAVDELEGVFTVVAHLYDPHDRHRLLLRTRVGESGPASLATITGVFAGASWPERETCEMFGIDFEGHPNLVPLLLPDGFEGYPWRKSFVLASRAAKPWPGAKEPGESDHGASPSRRKTLPPGVPDPATWGPRRDGEASP